METLLRVLSEDEKTLVHERSIKILTETGVKVNTAKGRQYLKDAGAEVDENSITSKSKLRVREVLH